MGIHAITQAQWKEVMGNNPSNFKDKDRPVEQVTWNECQEFIHKLTKHDGQEYRLPTEAEWEYACRAGTTTMYCSGNDLAALQTVGWCSYYVGCGSAKETKPVGQFQPNAWGLYDILGNVGEWCQDWYGEYDLNQSIDPQGPNNGLRRVIRGGSWFDFPQLCRSARRLWSGPAYRYFHVGFRIVLVPPSGPA